MARKGRPANNEPETAFDMRRVIALVQTLAHYESDDGIKALCASWGVEPVEDRSEPPYQGQYYINVWATLRKLAQHALAHAREEEK